MGHAGYAERGASYLIATSPVRSMNTGGGINTQGRHSFAMPEAVVKGELRPLRNPADDPD